MEYSKIVLITGASSGIGAACAKKFSAKGWKVILNGRRKERLEKLARQLSIEFQGESFIVHGDIADITVIKKEIERLPQSFQEIDVLVNNAGITLGEGPIVDRSLNDWNKMIDVNIRGMLNCTKLALMPMIKKNSGHIVNIGSTAGTYPRPGNPLYCASKAFSKQFALSLRADLAATKIRVTSIEPGTVKNTELALGRLAGNYDHLHSLYNGYDYLLPEDIAEAVYWAVSLPGRMNINRIDLMAQCQSFSNLVSRKDLEG